MNLESLCLKACLSDRFVPTPRLIWNFPKIRGTLFWGLYNKDPCIQGTILGSPIFGNYHLGPASMVKFEGQGQGQWHFGWLRVVNSLGVFRCGSLGPHLRVQNPKIFNYSFLQFLDVTVVYQTSKPNVILKLHPMPYTQSAVGRGKTLWRYLQQPQTRDPQTYTYIPTPNPEEL